jgi:hypothetical protein
VSDLVRYAAVSVRAYAAALPWFAPGLILSFAIGLPLSGPVRRMLRTRRSVSYLLIVSLGAILAATLPPGAAGFDRIGAGIGACDLERRGLATAHDYLSVSEVSLNVLLFIPLGLAIALLPWSRRTLAVAGAAFALPFVIELAQLAVPILGRECQSGDVIDNLLGLVLGLVSGAITVALARLATSGS